MNIKKSIYITLGIISTILALMGIVLPGLPVTPLILLAGWLFARSSDKLYSKLMSYELLASRIREYQEKRGLTIRRKLFIVIFMAVMVSISAFLMLEDGILRYIVLGAGVVGLIVVIFVVPTANHDTLK